jgi:hypothetical protein
MDSHYPGRALFSLILINSFVHLYIPKPQHVFGRQALKSEQHADNGLKPLADRPGVFRIHVHAVDRGGFGH